MAGKKTKKSKTNSGAGCLTVFGLVFFLAGSGVFLSGLWPLYQSWQAESWVKVEGTLLELRQIRGSDDTYGVEGLFSYQVAGKKYYSSKINYYSGADNIGNYQRNFYHSNKSKLAQKGAIEVFVDPMDPRQAVLDKSFRWSMLGFKSIFLFAFGGAGLGIMFAARAGKKKQQQQQIYQQQHPEQPWLWKQRWQGETISSDSKSGLIGITVFASFWNLIAIPAGVMSVIEFIDTGNKMALIGLLFPVVGVGLLYWALLLYLRHKKFGQSLLKLDERKVSIGDVQHGHISIEGEIEPHSEAIITLSCVKRTTKGSGKNKRTSEDVLWQSDSRAFLQAKEFHFNFEVPAGLPESDDSISRKKIIWRLALVSEQAGPDLKLNFEVPAFIGSTLSDEALQQVAEDELDLFSQPSQSNERSYQAADHYSSQKGDWHKLGVQASVNNFGNEYYFPAFRHLTKSLSLFLFGAVFCAAGLFAGFNGASIFFSAIFVVIGSLVAFWGLRLLTFKSQIRVSSGSLQYRTGHLFMGSFNVIATNDIKTIKAVSRSSYGNQKHYQLQLTLNDGQKKTIAKDLQITADIDSFIEKLKAELGINYS